VSVSVDEEEGGHMAKFVISALVLNAFVAGCFYLFGWYFDVPNPWSAAAIGSALALCFSIGRATQRWETTK
jgi:hypothetical protein